MNRITPWVLFLSILLAASDVIVNGQTSKHPGVLLVTNSGDHTLGIIDPDAGRQIAAVPVEGITGHEVAVSPDGELAFVPIYGDSDVGLRGTDGDQIAVVDLREQGIAYTLLFGHPARPYSAAFGPKDGLLYVTAELDNAVAIFDLHPKIGNAPSGAQAAGLNRAIMIGAIPTGQSYSHDLAISPDGRYGYTANVESGTVSVLDLHLRKLLTVIPVTTYLRGVSVSSDGRWVFTSNPDKPSIAVIDTKTNKVARWISLAGNPGASASTPDGKWLLVAMPLANKVAVIDLPGMRVKRGIDVPASPQSVLTRADGEFAYVSCNRSGKIAAVSLKNWSVRLIDAGQGADGLAWAAK